MLAKLMEKYDWDTSKIASTALESATNPLPQSTEIAHDILGYLTIESINIGDTVTYESRFGTRNYKVTVIKPIEETDWSNIVKETEVNTITTVTCIEEQPTKRLLVQAVQIE